MAAAEAAAAAGQRPRLLLLAIQALAMVDEGPSGIDSLTDEDLVRIFRALVAHVLERHV